MHTSAHHHRRPYSHVISNVYLSARNSFCGQDGDSVYDNTDIMTNTHINDRNSLSVINTKHGLKPVPVPPASTNMNASSDISESLKYSSKQFPQFLDRPHVNDWRSNSAKTLRQLKQCQVKLNEEMSPINNTKTVRRSQELKHHFSAKTSKLVMSSIDDGNPSPLVHSESPRLPSTLTKLKRSNSTQSTRPYLPLSQSRHRSSEVLEYEPITDYNILHNNLFNPNDKMVYDSTILSKLRLPPGSTHWSKSLGPPPAVTTIQEHPYLAELMETNLINNNVTYFVPDHSPFQSLPSTVYELNESLIPELNSLSCRNYRVDNFMSHYTHSGSGSVLRPQSAAFINLNRPQLKSETDHALRGQPGLHEFNLPACNQPSSGKTTQSAPSSNKSQIRFHHGTYIQQPHYITANTLSFSTPYSHHNILQQSSLQSAEFSQPISAYQENQGDTKNFPAQCEQVHQELDSVLARLLSEISTIDEHRPGLYATQLQSLTTKPMSLATTTSGSPNSQPTTVVAVLEAAPKIDASSECQRTVPCSSSQGSRDHPYITSDHSFDLKIPQQIDPINQQELTDRDLWNLKQQIQDLIQLEFDCKHKKSHDGPDNQSTRPASSLDKSNISSTNLTHSVPDVQFENEQTKRDGEDRRIARRNDGPKDDITDNVQQPSRKHPFRWSNSRRSYTKKQQAKLALAQNEQAGFLSEPKIQIKSLPLPDYELGSSLFPKFISDYINSSQAKSETEEDTIACKSIDSLTISQLTVLRELALLELTRIAEKYDTANRSPFTWRFLRYRAIANSCEPGLPSSTLKNSPISAKKLPSLVSHMTANKSTKESEGLLDMYLCQAHNSVSVNLKKKFIYSGSYVGPVFGQSLSSWQRRLGFPLPPAIVNMIFYLKIHGSSAHGIFRRPGGKLRMSALRQEIEKDINWEKFDDWQPYDVADLLKQFFRELPECLFTSKLSTLLVNVYTYIPDALQLDLLRWIIIKLPDENRFVLQQLLYLLNHLANYCDVTEMSASNLAVCFAPSLYRLIKPSVGTSTSINLSPRRLRRTTSGPDPKDLADQRAAQLSLSLMIKVAPSLFQVPSKFIHHVNIFSKPSRPKELEILMQTGTWSDWIQTHLTYLIRECSTNRPKYWIVPNREQMRAYHSDSGMGEILDSLELHYKKPLSGESESKTLPIPLRTWRCSIQIPEPDPKMILRRFSEERVFWDPEVQTFKLIDQISDCIDLCEIELTNVYPLPVCKLQLIRGIQTNLENNCCALLTESITSLLFNELSVNNQNSSIIIGQVYEDHVYIRPLNNGSECRVYFISRVDLRGRGADWYMHQWGHTLCRRLLNLKRSFSRKLSMPLSTFSSETNSCQRTYNNAEI